MKRSVQRRQKIKEYFAAANLAGTHRAECHNMFEKTKIITADGPPLTKGLVVFFFSLLWGIVSVASFMLLGHDILAASIAVAGLPIWMFLLRKEGTLDRRLRQQHSNYVQAQKGFCCQKCRAEIESPIKHQNKHGEPILYYCPLCDILWFTGSIDHSTA